MSLEDFKRAWRDLEVEEASREFVAHLATYIIVNAFLIFINLYTSPAPWFPYPLAGWGIGLAFHFLYSRRRFVVSRWETKVARIEARMRARGPQG